MEKKLTKWTFENELSKLPARCRKLTSKTSKEKARELFNKYSFLMSYNLEAVTRQEERLQTLQKVRDALKTGVVRFKGGFFIVSEVSSVETTSVNVIVFFKNGTKQSFVKDFEWINELF